MHIKHMLKTKILLGNFATKGYIPVEYTNAISDQTIQSFEAVIVNLDSVSVNRIVEKMKTHEISENSLCCIAQYISVVDNLHHILVNLILKSFLKARNLLLQS